MKSVRTRITIALRSACLPCLVAVVAQANTLERRIAVEEAMRRANDYFLANFAIGTAVWDRSAYHTGNFRAWETLGIESYHDRSVAWGEANGWLRGPEGATHADAHCCGQTYVDLYHVDPQPIRTNHITVTMANLVNTPASSTNDWTWIDAIYMAAPTLARLDVLNPSGPPEAGGRTYFDQLLDMYDYTKHTQSGGLFSAAHGLWYRDGDKKSRTPPAYPYSPEFWGRGNGWVIAACARVLEQLSVGDLRRAEFESMLRTMAAALLPLQQPDGFWRSNLLFPEHYPNPETSCTAFFTYAMAYGLNEGILVDAPGTNYTAAATNAWNGMLTLALHANGKLGYAQPIGAAPAAATYESDKDYAYGAFLLAGSEILRLLGGPVPVYPNAGPDLVLMDADGNHAEMATLSATNTLLRSGTIVGYSWWSGTNHLGSGPHLTNSFALGTNIVTLHILHSDGNTYTDSATIRVVGPPIARLHFDFEDAGLTTTDRLAGVSLNLLNSSGTGTDLHGPLGSGVAGAGRALDFTGAASQGGSGPIAVTQGNSALDFGTLNGFTVTLWINPSSTLLAGVYPRFFSLGPDGTTDRGNPGSLQLLNNGNFQPATSLQAFVNAAQTSTSGFGAFDLPVNQWRFVALTYDGVRLNLYGGSETNAVALMSSVNFPAGTLPTGGTWTCFVGNRLNRDRAFRGWLDDVRFFEHAAPLILLETVRREALAEPVIVPTRSGSDVLLHLQTRAGASYVLETTPNLMPPITWSALATNGGNGGLLTSSVPINPHTPARLYRYRIE